jgi:hypothetical protein
VIGFWAGVDGENEFISAIHTHIHGGAEFIAAVETG